MFFALFAVMPTAGAVVRVGGENTENTTAAVDSKKMTKKELRQERRQKRKEVRKEIKQAIKDWKKEKASDTTILLVILAILLPPLAVGIYEGGLTSRFWISLLLTLLFWIPGVIYALIVILE